MSDVETPYTNINAVADYFQVSVSTIRKWCRNGAIPLDTYIKVGEVYRFRLDDVEAALTAAQQKGQDSPLYNDIDGEQYVRHDPL